MSYCVVEIDGKKCYKCSKPAQFRDVKKRFVCSACHEMDIQNEMYELQKTRLANKKTGQQHK